MGKKLRNYLLAGAVVIVPLVVTFYVLWFFFGLLDGWARGLIFFITGKQVFGAGLLLIILVLLGTGIFATNFVGRRFIGFWEAMLARLPLVGVIYKTTKQIVEVVGYEGKRPFRQTVLIEYPRKGIYTAAFVTGEVKVKEGAVNRDLICVFVCTTPNPTTGFLVLVPREEVIYLANPVEDVIQLVLSGGLVGSFKNGAEGIVLQKE
ncbi:MAG: DUF502 domain-containing protein [Desulfotomaculales bacterium]